MDEELRHLIEQCAAAAMRAEPGDLLWLAQLHVDLGSIGELSADRPALALPARQAAELVEQIVLGKAADPAAALRQVVDLVQILQSAIGTGSVNGMHDPAE